MHFRTFGFIVIGLGTITIAFPIVFRYPFSSIIFIFGLFLLLTGIMLCLIGLVTEYTYQKRLVTIAVARIPHFIFHSFFLIIILIDIALLIIFLFFPGVIIPELNGHSRDIQVIGCIGTAGIMGGFIRQLQTNLCPCEIITNDTSAERQTDASSYVKFWSTLFSLFKAFFTSFVLFLLLRAGILKTVEVDTFNIYGVTGVAAVSGYFADSIIRRLSTVYEQLFDPSSKDHTKA